MNLNPEASVEELHSATDAGPGLCDGSPIARPLFSLAKRWRLAVVARLGLLVVIAAGCGAERYAGVTRTQAIGKARASLELLADVTEFASPGEARTLRRRIERHSPKAIRWHCRQLEAWKVVWPDTGAIFVVQGQGATAGSPAKQLGCF